MEIDACYPAVSNVRMLSALTTLMLVNDFYAAFPLFRDAFCNYFLALPDDRPGIVGIDTGQDLHDGTLSGSVLDRGRK